MEKRGYINNFVTIIGKVIYFQQKAKLLKIKKNLKKRTKKNSLQKKQSKSKKNKEQNS